MGLEDELRHRAQQREMQLAEREAERQRQKRDDDERIERCPRDAEDVFERLGLLGSLEEVQRYVLKVYGPPPRATARSERGEIEQGFSKHADPPTSHAYLKVSAGVTYDHRPYEEPIASASFELRVYYYCESNLLQVSGEDHQTARRIYESRPSASWDRPSIEQLILVLVP